MALVRTASSKCEAGKLCAKKLAKIFEPGTKLEATRNSLECNSRPYTDFSTSKDTLKDTHDACTYKGNVTLQQGGK